MSIKIFKKGISFFGNDSGHLKLLLEGVCRNGDTQGK